MKSLVGLLECLLQECGRRCTAPTVRDVKTLRNRVKHEGDSFITITLPRYCRDFERSLDQGRVGPGMFMSFKTDHAGIPRFLGGFLSDVFDQEGVLLDKPSINSIRSIRQICLFGKKVERPCSVNRNKAAIDRFVECDNEVVCSFSGQFARWFTHVARILYSGMHADWSDGLPDLNPKHGPGQTAERITGNRKYVHRRWHERLDRAGFHFLKYGRSTRLRDHMDLDSYPELVTSELEDPVRIVPVPKTLSTPRIIAVEPVCIQYAQQAVKRYLYRFLGKNRMTRGHLNFRWQRVNQEVAQAASGNGIYATLDMAEASDRVGLLHVYRMLESIPQLREMILACRSTRGKLPNGDIISLKKFSSMGSALCFPIEAMMFYTTIIASRLYRAGLFPTAHRVYSYSRDVYVYGDDLIVPVGEAVAICDDLESLGLKVNRHKSFWTGKFRESCGSDCYDYELVKPIYLRRDLPKDRKDVSGLLSSVSTANQLARAGYPKTSAAIRKVVENHLGRLPRVLEDSPAVGWWDSSEILPPQQYNEALQRRESLCLVPCPARVLDPLTGYPALRKALEMCGRNTLHSRVFRTSRVDRRKSIPDKGVDLLRLESSVRRYGLTLKHSWVPSSDLPPTGQ